MYEIGSGNVTAEIPTTFHKGDFVRSGSTQYSGQKVNEYSLKSTPAPSVAPVEQPVSVPPAPVDSRVPEKKGLGRKKEAAQESPWKGATTDDEMRWAGTRVDVAPVRRSDEAYSGTVERVINGGDTIEIRRDGFDSSFRVNASQVAVRDLIDSGPPKAKVVADKPAPTQSSDPIANPYRFAAQLKGQGVRRQEAWSRYVQAWGLRSTPMELDAKEFYAIYDSAEETPQVSPPPAEPVADVVSAPAVEVENAPDREQVATARPTALAKVDSDTIPADMQVTVEAIRGKTGQRVKVKQTAREAIADLDADAKLYKQILGCLGKK
jgi:hypothetical protein